MKKKTKFHSHVKAIEKMYFINIMKKANLNILHQSIAQPRYSQETTDQSFHHIEGLTSLQELYKIGTVHIGTDCLFGSNYFQDQ